MLFLSVSVYATNLETIVYSNVETTEAGCVKEFLVCEKDSKAPISKMVYLYDADGRMQEKTTYEWDHTEGWIGIQKYEYSYDVNNQPSVPVLRKWDKKKNNWIE